MSGKDVIWDNLDTVTKLYNKRKDQEIDAFITAKTAADIEKFIPIDVPIEMKKFCSNLKSKGYTNEQTVKNAIYELKNNKKIVLTTNRNNETYFQRV